MTPLTTLKIALFAPIPSARVRMARAVKPGVRAKPRIECRRSWTRSVMEPESEGGQGSFPCDSGMAPGVCPTSGRLMDESAMDICSRIDQYLQSAGLDIGPGRAERPSFSRISRSAPLPGAVNFLLRTLLHARSAMI